MNAQDTTYKSYKNDKRQIRRNKIGTFDTKKTTIGRNVENKKKQKKGSKDKEYDTGNASQDTRYVKYDPRHLTHDTRPRLNKCDSEDTNHDPKNVL